MSRAEFEERLLRDEQLRGELDALGILGTRKRHLQAELDQVMEQIRDYVYSLHTEQGAPGTLLAHQLGISPQRVGSLVQEGAARR